MDKKTSTVQSYITHAAALAKKFDQMGPRVGDIEKVLKHASPHPTVLELGCGNGRDAFEILKRTPYYLGIDISPEMIKLAQQKNPRGDFKVHDLETFPIPLGIEVIFAFASLIHSPKTTLTEIVRRAYEAQSRDGLFRISLKYAHEYREVATNDQFGYRNYFLYSLNDIEEIAGRFLIKSMERPVVNNQPWLEVLLQK